jgi:hypothetical protein
MGFYEKGKLIKNRNLIFKNYIGKIYDGYFLTDILSIAGLIVDI